MVPQQRNVSNSDAALTEVREVEAAFRPRARMLRLLGDELIRSPHIAVFELLKNSYDADATEVTVTLERIERPDEAVIVVEDDGSGMTFETVIDVWLEPGTDFRARQKSKGLRSPRFGRLPMGEKGIGRFAVHKLGEAVELVTRASNSREIVVALDWEELEHNEYLSEAALTVVERPPTVFAGRTGTRITISRVRERWTKRMGRLLRRSVTAMTSPFEGVESFQPQLILDPDPGWFKGLLEPSEVLESALFHAHAHVDPETWNMSYDYCFSPPPNAPRIAERAATKIDVPLAGADGRRPGARYLRRLAKAARDALDDDRPTDIGVGPFTLELHIFDLDRDTRALLQPTDYTGIREFLAINGGVRVYRDGIRVYDYGEPENDWLELDARRVNVPTQRISNRLVIGAVHLDSTRSGGLVEKTNREGFVETPSYEYFRIAVQSAIQHIVIERNRDKLRLRKLIKERREPAEPVAGALHDLRDRVRGLGLEDDLGPLIDRAEAEYDSFRETLLVTAGAGLTVTVVVHEVEKAIALLNRALDRDATRERLVELGQHLAEVIDSLGFIARKSDQTSESASELVSVALRAIDYRFSHHEVEVRNGFDTHNDFTVTGQRRLIVGTLLNLFDNAIYWLNAQDPPIKRLYVGPTRELGEAPGIVVADNGPGLIDPPDLLTQPFMTRKADGMGLGLYIANEVMRAHNGRLLFPAPGDMDVPPEYDGTCVVLLFKER